VKQLLPVAGKPVSEYALLNLIEPGIRDVNIIVGDVGQNEVKDYYSNGSKWNVNISSMKKVDLSYADLSSS